MAKCEVCGKSVQFGCSVSHSHKTVKKMWKPNIQRVKVLENGRIVKKKVCTSCLRSGKVTKVTSNAKAN